MLAAGALVVVVLAIDAVAVGENKMQAETAPAAQALHMSSMLLTDALLVLHDMMLPDSAPMQMVHAPNLTPVEKDETR